MRVLTKDELLNRKVFFLKELKNKIFIYPTDTIYGIGCDATNEELVKKIREIKNSSIAPFLILVPGKEWVYKNCIVDDKAKKWVEKMGQYCDINGEKGVCTLILKLKNKKAITQNVTLGIDTIGVRIPTHWFSGFIKNMNIPIISTSANKTGGNFMRSLEDLHPDIKQEVDYIIYEGEKTGRPSTLIHLEKEEVKIKKR
jgi:L-threonylcarbamoyladenylate synthase